MKEEILKKKRHLNNCSAPICQCDDNPNYEKEVLWIPGETICRQQPYKKFQKVQLSINEMLRKGKWSKMDGMTAKFLEQVKIPLKYLYNKPSFSTDIPQNEHSPIKNIKKTKRI